MITYEKVTRDSLEPIADFIAALNQERSEQSGWLGSSREGILEGLSTLPYIPFEDSHIAAYENDQLVGVFGFYAFPEKQLIRLIGPHVQHAAWLEVTQGLWEHLLKLAPDSITTAKGFADSQNSKCLDFFAGLGMTEYNAEALMTLNRAAYAPVEPPHSQEVRVQEYSEEYAHQFKALHPEQSFFTGQEILNQLSTGKKLFLLTENGQVKGYTYMEVFFETGTAEIIQLYVDEHSRNKKYGSLLISHLIHWAFSQPQIQEVGLSVRLTNPARRLYERLGFAETNVIVAMEKEF